MSCLAEPDENIIAAFKGHKVVECGAGDGKWLTYLNAHGIDAIGYDKEPRGPNVIEGDHSNLGKHSDRVLLIVWPPDRTKISEWQAAHDGEYLAVCGRFSRFSFDVELDVLLETKLHGERKGNSQFVFGKISHQ